MTAADRVVSREALAARIATERGAGVRVVFTNGVFDLLHIGHVRYLESARSLGDMLVVAVNSDASVQHLRKGPGRPIVPQAERAELVAALRCVDYVCIFDEVLPDVTIRALRPDIHVKSAQYDARTLPEADAVREVGARIEIVPHVAARSTSAIVERVRKDHSA